MITSEVVFYPNPNTGQLYISKPNDIEEVYIYDITGKLVFSQYAGEEKVTLDSQINGMYIVRIKFKNGNRRTERLIINKEQ